MMTGAHYQIQGIDIFTPVQGGWKERTPLGIDGFGNPVLPPHREYEFDWDYLDGTGFSNIQSIYEKYGCTGTVSLHLPIYGAGGWAFATYSGAVMQEPKYDHYEEGYYNKVVLLISKIPLMGVYP
jgi:hypothetical protein